MKCAYCKNEFEPQRKGHKYCAPDCKQEAQKKERRRRTAKTRRERELRSQKILQHDRKIQEARRRATLSPEDELRTALETFTAARERLAAVREVVPTEVVAKIETSHALEEALKRFDDEAQANADNVTRARSRQFIGFCGDWLHQKLARFLIAKGYTDYDGECIMAKLQEEPRPIVIEADRAVSPANIMGFEIGDDPDLDFD